MRFERVRGNAWINPLVPAAKEARTENISSINLTLCARVELGTIAFRILNNLGDASCSVAAF
jgi:hypothetical protein